MSINIAELHKQREALVRTINEFVEYRDENDADTEVLSGLVRTIDQLLATDPDRHTWRIVVDTDSDGILYDGNYVGTGEGLEAFVENVVKENLVGADDKNHRPINTLISITAVPK